MDLSQPQGRAWLWVALPVLVAAGVVVLAVGLEPDTPRRSSVRREPPARLVVTEEEPPPSSAPVQLKVIETRPETTEAPVAPAAPEPVEEPKIEAARIQRIALASAERAEPESPRAPPEQPRLRAVDERATLEQRPEPSPARYDAGVDGAAVLAAIERGLSGKGAVAPSPTPRPAAPVVSASMPSASPVAPRPTTVATSGRAGALDRVRACNSMQSCAAKALEALKPYGGVSDAPALAPTPVASFEEARLNYRRTQGAVLRTAKKLAEQASSRSDAEYFRAVFEAMPRSEQWELEPAEAAPIRRLAERSVNEWLRGHRLSLTVPLTLVLAVLTAGEGEPMQVALEYRRGGVGGMDDLAAKLREDLLKARELRDAPSQRLARIKLLLNPGGTLEIR